MIDDEMIELNELRIGNLLEYKGEIAKVTMLSCDIDDEYEDQICFVKHGTSSNEKGGWNRSLVNDLKRIPLTPEWLERCGFVKTQFIYPGDWKRISVEAYINGQFVIRFIDLIDRKGYRAEYFPYPQSQNTLPGWIDYLHQLQNKYFWWTDGIELEIKIP